jgi:hypothetical protein
MTQRINTLAWIAVCLLFYASCSEKSAEITKVSGHLYPVPKSNASGRTNSTGIYYGFSNSGYVTVPASSGYTKQITVRINTPSTPTYNQSVSLTIAALPNNTCYKIKSINYVSAGSYNRNSDTNLSWNVTVGPGSFQYLTFTLQAVSPTSCVEGAWSITMNGPNYQTTNYTDDYAYFINNPNQ